MVPDFFAVETSVFMLQLSDIFSGKSYRVATSRVRGHGRVRCDGKEIAVGKVGRTLAAINCLRIRVCICAGTCVHVYVCPSLVVLISSKINRWSLDLDILQVLVRLLALLCILVDVFRSRYTICHSSRERWGKFEF